MNVRPQFHDRRRADEPLGWGVVFNSLSTYHALILIGVCLWGAMALLGVDPPSAVSDALHGRVYVLWAVLHLVSPPLVWVGMWIRYLAVYGCRSKIGEKAGWRYGLVGDTAICLMITTTLFAVLASRETMWILFMAGLTLLAAMLAMRDFLNARKIKTPPRRRLGDVG